MRKEKVLFRNAKSQRLGGFLYVPDGKGPFPAIVFIHGMTGGTHEIKNRFMCDALADNGFVVLIFDFYDKPNGLSEPKIENMSLTQQVKDTASAIDFIESFDFVNAKRIGLTGHSMGGTTAILYAASRDPRVKALVVQSAAPDIRNTEVSSYFENKRTQSSGFARFDKSWGSVNVKLSFYEDVKSYDVFKKAEMITCPTLMFHGDEDETVPVKDAKKLFEHIKAKERKLTIIKGADHAYYNSPTLHVATKLLTDWFKKYL